jgi:hypothetical protein
MEAPSYAEILAVHKQVLTRIDSDTNCWGYDRDPPARLIRHTVRFMAKTKKSDDLSRGAHIKDRVLISSSI